MIIGSSNDAEYGCESDGEDGDDEGETEREPEPTDLRTRLTKKELKKLETKMFSLNLGAKSLGCVLHTLQNSLKDALKLEEYTDIIAKVEKIVRRGRTSIVVMESLRESHKVLKKAVVTR
jgi:hypothetical protein